MKDTKELTPILKNKENEDKKEDSNKKGESQPQGNDIKTEGKLLYDKLRKDLGLSEFAMKKAMSNVENWVLDVESHRNFKMQTDFDKEKEFKLREQNEIKNQIEELSNDSANEQLISYFNTKIAQQEDLYKKYFEMNEEIKSKINELKNNIPSLEQKVKNHNIQLKKLNKENLKLMDQISKIENELSYQNNYNYEYNPNLDPNINSSLSSSVVNTNDGEYANSVSLSSAKNNINLSEQNISNGSVESINLNEVIEENEEIRNKYNKIIQLKKIFMNKKKENKNLMKSITEMNTDCFSYKKMFNEGMHEIAKELLKIHEMQLDKVINSNSAEGEEGANNVNSLYFEMVRGNYKGNNTKNDDSLKLPMINNNIKKKYNYPLIEKRTPEALIALPTASSLP
ncbi:MAG: hypothetical protein HUJ63_12425 [Enterococcus sp.]|nr:hypothetical protein [Enterococcus sp.]